MVHLITLHCTLRSCRQEKIQVTFNSFLQLHATVFAPFQRKAVSLWRRVPFHTTKYIIKLVSRRLSLFAERPSRFIMRRLYIQVI